MNGGSAEWRVRPAAWLPVGLAIAAEAASNALRAYGLGTHLEQFTWTALGVPVALAGIVLAAAAVAVSLAQARAAWLMLAPHIPGRQRLLAGAATLLLTSISATAMVSHILEAGRSRAAHEGKGRTDHDRLAAEIARVEAELAGLTGTRSTTEVRAAMDAARVPPAVWTATRQCTDADLLKGRLNNEACRPILDLRQEMARAIRKAEIEPIVARLRADLATRDRPEAAGRDEVAAADLWAWLMGSGLVLLATFGPVLFAAPDTRPGRSDRISVRTCPGTPLRTPTPQSSRSSDEPIARAVTPNRSSDPADAPGQTSEPKSRTEAERDLLMLLALGRSAPSQTALAVRWGRPKQTVSDWLSGWERAGLIPPRRTIGRRKAVGGR